MGPKLPKHLNQLLGGIPVKEPKPILEPEEMVNEIKRRFNLSHGKGKRKRKGMKKK